MDTATTTTTSASTDAAETGRDVGLLERQDLPFRTFPELAGKRQRRFQALVKQSVLNEIYKHGESVDRIEVCGVLIGNLYRDDDGPFLYIEASIRGDNAASQAAQVTFTAEAWVAIQATMDRDHPT